MIRTKVNQKNFSSLRAFEQNEIYSFLSLEDITNNQFISKRFFLYLKSNYQKLIIKYILKITENILSAYDPNLKINLNSPSKKYLRKFLKSYISLENRYDFRLFFESIVLKKFIQFAAYKSDVDFYQNKKEFHYQNIFDYNNNWFFSETINIKSFNIFASVYIDENEKQIPYINKDFCKNIKDLKSEDIIFKIKDVIKVIDQNIIAKNYDFNDIPTGREFSIYDLIDLIFPFWDFKTKKLKNFNNSGIEKFINPAEEDVNFFDKIFNKNKNLYFI